MGFLDGLKDLSVPLSGSGGGVGDLGSLAGTFLGGPAGGAVGGVVGDILGEGSTPDRSSATSGGTLSSGAWTVTQGGSQSNIIILIAIVAAVYYLSKKGR